MLYIYIAHTQMSSCYIHVYMHVYYIYKYIPNLYVYIDMYIYKSEL